MTQPGVLLATIYIYNKCMSEENAAAFQINRDELTTAIIELNSMSPCDGVVMKRDGHVTVGYTRDEDTLCMLIPAPLLARQLTADGLASYSGKELKKWAEGYDLDSLQQIMTAALQ